MKDLVGFAVVWPSQIRRNGGGLPQYSLLKFMQLRELPENYKSPKDVLRVENNITNPKLTG